MAEIRHETLRVAVVQALRDRLMAETTHIRDEVTLPLLVQLWRETGTKTVEVRLPDGMQIATLSLVEPSDQIVVTDRAAFTEWVQKRAPEMVTQDDSPHKRVTNAVLSAWRSESKAPASPTGFWMPLAQVAASAALAELGINPDPPEPRVSRSYEEALLAELQPVERIDPALPTDPDAERDRGVVLPETGEIVPGVEYRPAGEPTSFRLSYKPQGREAIALAWREGRLPAIEGLPEVTS